ncbi:MAG TPA: acyltransferase [Gemmataceae bacterium]|jgi:peptidoglycan/LPS O-acetylase OafA/YrhL|nr:acyltransferase [Gemmataceae bacterium]
MATLSDAEAEFHLYRARKYVPELDGVRALCIVGVVGDHLNEKAGWAWFSGGLGVYVFFVLSGYLITTLALREERAIGHLSYKAFYIRRTLRIFPLYYLAVLVYCGLLFGTSWGRDTLSAFTHALPYYLTYLQELPYTYDTIVAGHPSPFGHSWSLGIEEKYYLVWPVLAFGLWACRPLTRLRGTIVLLILFASTQSLGRLSPDIHEWRLELVLYPYSHILWGCLLAILLDDSRWYQRLRWLGSPSGMLVCLAAFVAAQVAYEPISGTLRELMIFHGLATTALIGSILMSDGPVQWLLRTRPLVFLGKMSYGMYLFHGLGVSAAQKAVSHGRGPVFEWLTYAVAVTVTVGIAYVMAITVERPFIGIGRRWSDTILRKKQKPPVEAVVISEASGAASAAR